MNAVANTAPAASSGATRVPQVVPEQTSAGSAHSSPAQPFTDVLSEQTSKAPRDVLDKNKPDAPKKKGESTVIPPSLERLTTRSRKSVSVDASTQSVPLVVPVVPVATTETALVAVGVTTKVTEAAPVAALAPVHPLIELTPGTTQATAAVDVGKEDSKPPVSPQEVGASALPALAHPDLGHSDLVQTTGLSHVLPTEGVVSGAPVVRAVAAGENAGQVGSSGQPSTSTTGLTNPTGEPRITVRSRPLGSDQVVKAAPEAHSSQRGSAGPNVGANPEHLRDASIRVTSRPVESTSDFLSSPLAHSQPVVAPVSSALPISALVSGESVFGAHATDRIVQSMPHSLDVGALAGAISRPLNEGSGGYTVVIAMRPADLGQLQAVVTLHGNDLQVSITPQTHVGRDALANAVDTLKNELSRGGVNVNVTLHDPGFQSRGEDRPATAVRRNESFSPDEPVVISSPAPVLTANQIHLIL